MENSGRESRVVEQLIIYGLLGRLVVWLWQISPYQRVIDFIGNTTIRGYLQELFDCDLCSGVWAYFILALIMKINMYESFYVPIVSEILTGASMSFIAHLIALGWKEKFSTIIIN